MNNPERLFLTSSEQLGASRRYRQRQDTNTIIACYRAVYQQGAGLHLPNHTSNVD
jgi:hypothetical protein